MGQLRFRPCWRPCPRDDVQLARAGYLFVNVTFGLDIPMIVGITVVITIMLMIANLITDLVYGLIDPRVRLG